MVHLRWLLTYALCLVTISEQFSSETAFFVPMEITNRAFTTALLNPANEEYQTMYKEVSDLLKSVFDCPDSTTCPTNQFYGGVVSMTFRSGSVIANATILFKTTSINRYVINAYFHMYANNVKPQILQLNMDYTTPENIQKTTVPRTTISTTTTTDSTTTPPPSKTTTATLKTVTAPTTTTTTALKTMTPTTTTTTSTTTTLPSTPTTTTTTARSTISITTPTTTTTTTYTTTTLPLTTTIPTTTTTTPTTTTTTTYTTTTLPLTTTIPTTTTTTPTTKTTTANTTTTLPLTTTIPTTTTTTAHNTISTTTPTPTTSTSTTLPSTTATPTTTTTTSYTTKTTTTSNKNTLSTTNLTRTLAIPTISTTTTLPTATKMESTTLHLTTQTTHTTNSTIFAATTKTTRTTRLVTTITTTLATTMAPIGPALTSTTTTIENSTTAPSTRTNGSADYTVLVSSTMKHHGNRGDNYTTGGRENTTHDPVNIPTTLNPHDKHTDSQDISSGKPSDPVTSGGSSSDERSDRVPGWGIALLVLAATILLLLIIIFVLMLVQWCCRKTENGHMDSSENPHYPEKKQPLQEHLPVYSPQPPVTQKPGSIPVIKEDTSRKNRAGFYAVNP